ncbi:MAG: AraC family transcriptional regulator [Cyclobacteriaceae bacterium]|jgi:AraC-like DNA-binding protein|nr:AraC family transcriptional regulator [Cyclobacteriaceae bacterium]
MAVQQVIEKSGLHAEKVSLGEVVLKEENLPENKLNVFDKELQLLGFERIDDRKARMIEAMKNRIIQLIHHADRVNLKQNWSDILAEEMHHEYNYLSSLFSSVEGITIEQYIIRQKIERAKELLFYDELTISEIADRLGYSSIAHLSAQFKKVTGLTPSELKKSREIDKSRKPLDSL